LVDAILLRLAAFGFTRVRDHVETVENVAFAPARMPA
jgi:hypothetical protein